MLNALHNAEKTMRDINNMLQMISEQRFEGDMHLAVQDRKQRFEDSRRLSIICLYAISILSLVLFLTLPLFQEFTMPIIAMFICLVIWPVLKLSRLSNEDELHPGPKAKAAINCAAILKAFLMISIFIISAVTTVMYGLGEVSIMSPSTALLVIMSLVSVFLMVCAAEVLSVMTCKDAAQQIYASDLKREWGVDNASSFEGILRAVKDGGFDLQERIKILHSISSKLDEIASKLSEGDKTHCNKIEKDFLKSCEQLINDSRSFSSVIKGIDEISEFLIENVHKTPPSSMSSLPEAGSRPSPVLLHPQGVNTEVTLNTQATFGRSRSF